MHSRSYHFIPAHRVDMIAKSVLLEADYLVFDLEDAVPADMKDTARNYLWEHLEQANLDKVFVRINPFDEQDFFKDMDILSTFKIKGIVLPKIETKQQLKNITDYCLNKNKSLQFIALIESFAGIENAKQITRNENIFAIGLGLEDLLSKLTIMNEDASDLIKYIRMQFIMGAKAGNLMAIDTISNSLQDINALQAECTMSRNLGFDSKFSIHPNQLKIINDSFSIDSNLKHWAEQIIKLSDNVEQVGYTKVNGELITPPKVKKAKTILGIK